MRLAQSPVGAHATGSMFSTDPNRTDAASERPGRGIEVDDKVGRATAPWKVVYAIVERGPRKHWLRIGMAFVNRDGSLNVRLDAVPLTGQLHIRENSPRDGRDGSGEPLPPFAFERDPAAFPGRPRISSTALPSPS